MNAEGLVFCTLLDLADAKLSLQNQFVTDAFNLVSAIHRMTCEMCKRYESLRGGASDRCSTYLRIRQ